MANMSFLCRMAGWAGLHPGGKDQDIMERLYLSVVSVTSGVPSEELVQVAREKSIWISLLRLLPLGPGPK